MKLVANFKDGAFSSVTEGLMVDSSGNYYIGGELPIPQSRVKSMDSAGELEWVGANLLNAASAPAETPAASITPTEKKSKIPLVVAAVVAVIVVAVAAVLVTNNIRAVTEQDSGSARGLANGIEQSEPLATDTGEDADFPLNAATNFVFFSGAAGWVTEITVQSDGSFSGEFWSSDWETGPEFPEGTLYLSEFSGRFSNPQRISEYEYLVTVENLSVDGTVGAERIEDGVRIITVEPHGFEGTGEFRLYLADRATADLPNDFLDWVLGPHVIMEDDGSPPVTLPLHGLFNASEGYGFLAVE